MKKILLVVLVLVVTTASINVQAQTQPAFKIGVFDIDLMVQAMPGYRAVDSALQIYERDSLSGEYEFAQKEYQRLDSTYKADSAKGQPKSVLEYIAKQRNEFAITLVYWQQIAQNKMEQKRGELAQGLFEKVFEAYRKVLDKNKYVLILKPNTYELGSNVDNVFALVAKELKIQLPPELGGGMEIPEEKPAPQEKKPATPNKPAGKN